MNYRREPWVTAAGVWFFEAWDSGSDRILSSRGNFSCILVPKSRIITGRRLESRRATVLLVLSPRWNRGLWPGWTLDGARPKAPGNGPSALGVYKGFLEPRPSRRKFARGDGFSLFFECGRKAYGGPKGETSNAVVASAAREGSRGGYRFNSTRSFNPSRVGRKTNPRHRSRGEAWPGNLFIEESAS